MAPTGNGGKRFVFNTRERALSGDQNRVQNVHDQMLAEILRGLFDASSELDQKAGSVEVFSTGSETPPSATIIAGIRPRPEVGTINLFVEGGSLVIVDKPAPTTDESKLAFVVDPGVQTAGVLTLTPGSGGSIRIDVIECQRIEPVLESDNRDIFNPSTGLFTPAMVDKVVAARLTYRIRTGTIGGGFPGIAAGWLPLAVCSVPSGATTWDDVTLWDVRPLASERVQQPFNAYPSLNYVHRHNVACDNVTAPGEIRQSGVVDVSFGAYRAGGRLIHPGTTNDYIDVANTTLWAAGFASAALPWYLYAVFPFGLPRWVQYSPASAGIREPRGIRGIPVVSRWEPRYDGRPSINAALTPAWTGLLDPASQNAILLLAGLQADPGGGPTGILADGHVIHFVEGPTKQLTPIATDTVNSTTWQLNDSTSQPGNARAVYLKLQLIITVTAGTPKQVEFYRDVSVGGPDGTTTNTATIVNCGNERGYIYAVANTTYALEVSVRVPLAYTAQTFVGTRQFNVFWAHAISASGLTFTITSRLATIMGWELGP